MVYASAPWADLHALGVVGVDNVAGRPRYAVGAPREALSAALSPLLSSATAGVSAARVAWVRGSGVLARRCGLARVSATRSGEDWEAAVVVPLAARLGDKFGRALDLPEGKARVVGVGEPVEPPMAPRLKSRGERRTLVSGGYAAVRGTGETAELGSASVKKPHATARHVQVEVVAAQVTTGAGRLNNHGLSGHRPGGEREAEKGSMDVLAGAATVTYA